MSKDSASRPHRRFGRPRFEPMFLEDMPASPLDETPTYSEPQRLPDFLSRLKGLWGFFLFFGFAFVFLYLLTTPMSSSLGLPPVVREVAFLIFVGLLVPFVGRLISVFFRDEEPEEDAVPRRVDIGLDEHEWVKVDDADYGAVVRRDELDEADFEVGFDHEGHEVKSALPPEPEKGDARSMLRRAIDAAPSPTSSASVVVGPRLWAFYAWVFLATAAALTALTLSGRPYKGYELAAKIAFVIPVDILAMTTVLIWTLRRRIVADATGIRQVVAGRTVETLPWGRVKLIEYGICRRNTSQHTCRAAGFIDIRDRRRWQTVYADSVFYSVNTRMLAKFARFIVEEAARHGIRAEYVDRHWSSDWL